jgi:hypothetical protein
MFIAYPVEKWRQIIYEVVWSSQARGIEDTEDTEDEAGPL